MPEKPYAPPYKITDAVIGLISKVSERAGVVSVANGDVANPRLRRDNRIKTIHSSLAIENNSLSLAQVTDVINGKRVLGAEREIREVRNAYEAYNILPALDPFKIKDMLRAHRVLMAGLAPNAGCFRSGGVGIFAGKRLVHAAPPAKLVPKLAGDLVQWAKTSGAHPLITACVFHYEFEFIHPFSDGNGRMGRMWQTLILSRWKPVFAWLPAETLVRKRQREYYAALAASDAAADSTAFVEFMLRIICDALGEFLPDKRQDVLVRVQVRDQVTDRTPDQVKRLMAALGRETLPARELLERLGLKHRRSFRDSYLTPALKLGLIEMTEPEKPNSSKQKYRAATRKSRPKSSS